MSLTSKSLPTSQMRVDRSIPNAEEPESVSYARGSPSSLGSPERRLLVYDM